MGMLGMVITIVLVGLLRDCIGMAKKPRKKKDKVKADIRAIAHDEQFTAAICQAVGNIKDYSPRGMLVAQDDDGSFKVVCYDEAEDINGLYDERMSLFIRAAISAMAAGTGGASNFEV
jgi:hypothetical protein